MSYMEREDWQAAKASWLALTNLVWAIDGNNSGEPYSVEAYDRHEAELAAACEEVNKLEAMFPLSPVYASTQTSEQIRLANIELAILRRLG